MLLGENFLVVALIMGMVLVDSTYLHLDLIVQRCGCFVIHMVLLYPKHMYYKLAILGSTWDNCVLQVCSS